MTLRLARLRWRAYGAWAIGSALALGAAVAWAHGLRVRSAEASHAQVRRLYTYAMDMTLRSLQGERRAQDAALQAMQAVQRHLLGRGCGDTEIP